MVRVDYLKYNYCSDCECKQPKELTYCPCGSKLRTRPAQVRIRNRKPKSKYDYLKENGKKGNMVKWCKKYNPVLLSLLKNES